MDEVKQSIQSGVLGGATFESFKRTNQFNAEYWSARDLSEVSKRIRSSTPKLELDERDSSGLLGEVAGKTTSVTTTER